MTIISANIGGHSSPKRDLIAKLCCEHNCQVLCLQETHKGPNNNRPTITGMKMSIERPHEKYGSAIYVKPDLVTTMSSTPVTEAFSTDLDTLSDIDPSTENYDRFVKVVHATVKKHIPRGCRKNYVPGLTTYTWQSSTTNTSSCTNKTPSPQPPSRQETNLHRR